MNLVVQEVSAWQEIALVAAPAISAVAAGASWASVAQARKLAREARNPILSVNVIFTPNDDGSKTMGAIIRNIGEGAARGVGFVLCRAPYLTAGPVGDTYLLPGEARRIWTAIPRDEAVETHALVLCRDRESYAHYWTENEDHRVLKTWLRRRPKYAGDAVVAFGEYFPDSNVAHAAEVEYSVLGRQ